MGCVVVEDNSRHGRKMGEGAYAKIFCDRWNLGGKYANDSGHCLSKYDSSHGCDKTRGKASS